MNKKISAIIAATSIATTLLPMHIVSAEPTPLKIGDYVKMGTYNNTDILWRCIGFEKITGTDADGNPTTDATQTATEYEKGYLPLFISDEILFIKPMDGHGTETLGGVSSHANNVSGKAYSRQTHGSSYWGDSNMRCWLNSTATAGNVVWTCGNAPSDENVFNGYNNYENEAGFLTNFSELELSAVKTVNQKQILHRYEKSTEGDENYLTYATAFANSAAAANYATAYSEYLADTMFVLDIQQIVNLYNNDNLLGSGAYYKGVLSKGAVDNSELKLDALTEGAVCATWLRTPHAADGDFRCFFRASAGNVAMGSAHIAGGGESYPKNAVGTRPAFFMNTNAEFTGTGTETDPYVVEAVTAAQTSASNTVLDTFEGINNTKATSVLSAITLGADTVNTITWEFNGKSASYNGTALSGEGTTVNFGIVIPELATELSGLSVSFE